MNKQKGFIKRPKITKESVGYYKMKLLKFILVYDKETRSLIGRDARDYMEDINSYIATQAIRTGGKGLTGYENKWKVEKTSPMKELDTVELTHDIKKHDLKEGDFGAIVLVYNSGKAYEVEFVMPNGRTKALLTLMPDDIKKIKLLEKKFNKVEQK